VTHSSFLSARHLPSFSNIPLSFPKVCVAIIWLFNYYINLFISFESALSWMKLNYVIPPTCNFAMICLGTQNLYFYQFHII
jgi:hypothetical protein